MIGIRPSTFRVDRKMDDGDYWIFELFSRRQERPLRRYVLWCHKHNKNDIAAVRDHLDGADGFTILHNAKVPAKMTVALAVAAKWWPKPKKWNPP